MKAVKSGRYSFLTGHWPLRKDLPTVVFIHGAGGNAQGWRKQVEGLSDVANTLALDLPGHGASDDHGLDSISDYAGFTAGFIKELELHQAIACGLSMGGGIALQLLLDYADWLKAGILIGTGARLRVAPFIFETIGQDYEGFVKLLSGLLFAENAGLEAVREISSIMQACPPEVTAGDFRACDSFDVTERVSGITRPVLIISGEEDQITPPKYADFLEKSIANSVRSHILGAGHMIPNERPFEVNAAIRSFIESNFDLKANP